MRIVHTCLRYPPSAGGAEDYCRQIVNLTKKLPDHPDVRVLTSRLKTHHPATLLDPSQMLDDPPYVQRLHHHTIPKLAYPRLQAMQYYLRHHRPDVIHGYSYWYHPADAAARYARRHKIPYIFHPIYYTNSNRQKNIWRIYSSAIGRRTFSAADAVVVISPQEQALIKDAGLPVKKFYLIPPSVNPAEFSLIKLNPFLKRKLAGPILLTVSRIAPGKGLEDLIAILPQVISAFPGLKLALAGEDFGAKSILQEQVQKLGLINHVHFLGRLTRLELIGAYQHADLFIHPSHYEAFGIVLAESLAAATPVVARHTASIPYVVPDGQAGLLFQNKDAMARNIIKFLSDQKLANKLGSFGADYVRQNFSPEINQKKVANLYRDNLIHP